MQELIRLLALVPKELIVLIARVVSNALESDDPKAALSQAAKVAGAKVVARKSADARLRAASRKREAK